MSNNTSSNHPGSANTVSRPRQARWWIATIRESDWSTCLPDGVLYVKGQLEIGEGGFRHWQLVFAVKRPISLHRAKELFPGTGHFEPTRSAAAREYVWKEATRVADTQFELGSTPLRRNSATDWDSIKDAAVANRLDEIPSDVYVRYYRTLLSIAADHAKPEAMLRKVRVFYGPTGTGKSHSAWEAAGTNGYAKDPRSKFWYGYKGQENVVLDEFRGGIDVAHMLRWTDKYPCLVEIKGSSRNLCARNIWITSNLHPRQWYPDLDSTTLDALCRRMEIIEMTESYNE